MTMTSFKSPTRDQAEPASACRLRSPFSKRTVTDQQLAALDEPALSHLRAWLNEHEIASERPSIGDLLTFLYERGEAVRLEYRPDDSFVRFWFAYDAHYEWYDRFGTYAGTDVVDVLWTAVCSQLQQRSTSHATDAA